MPWALRCFLAYITTSYLSLLDNKSYELRLVTGCGQLPLELILCFQYDAHHSACVPHVLVETHMRDDLETDLKQRKCQERF